MVMLRVSHGKFEKAEALKVITKFKLGKVWLMTGTEDVLTHRGCRDRGNRQGDLDWLSPLRVFQPCDALGAAEDQVMRVNRESEGSGVSRKSEWNRTGSKRAALSTDQESSTRVHLRIIVQRDS